MSVMSYISHLLQNVKFKTLNYLPNICVLCGDLAYHLTNLCLPCRKNLPIIVNSCKQCAQILPTEVEVAQCGFCLRDPPAFSHTYAAFSYATPIDFLLSSLKFNGRLLHAQTVAMLLCERLPVWYQQQKLPDLIMPVPLHPQRLRVRGFNQALEIAKPIARHLHVPLDYVHLFRHKPTLPQTYLKSKIRKTNVKQAFTALGDFSGLTIALLDDVITTGFTARACARVLRAQGAEAVHVWCVARR